MRLRIYSLLLGVAWLVPLASCGGGGGGSGGGLTGRGSVEGFLYLDGANTLHLSRSATPPAGMTPAAGAALSIQGTGVTGASDAAGRFRLAGIPAGSRTLMAAPPGAPAGTFPITIIGDAAVQAGDPPVTRQAAFNAVKQAAQDIPLEKLLILGTQNPLPAGVTVYPQMADPARSVDQSLVGQFNSEQWFFLADPHSAFLFKHPVRYYFVDAQTGAVTRIDAESWPLINGVPFYRSVQTSLTSADLLNEPSDIENEPPPRSVSLAPPAGRHHVVPECTDGVTYALVVNGSADDLYMANSALKTIQTLQSLYGVQNVYSVNSLLKQRPPESIDAKLREIKQRARPCDTVLIFIMGHGYDGGLMDADYDEQSGFLGLYTNSKSELISPDTFDFDGLKACHLHIYIECCFSGDWIQPLSAKLLPKTGLDATIITATDGDHRGLALSNYTFVIGVDPVLVFNSYFLEAASQLGAGAYDPISLYDRARSNLEAARFRQGWPGAYARLALRANPQLWVRPRQPGEVCSGTDGPGVAVNRPPQLIGLRNEFSQAAHSNFFTVTAEDPDGDSLTYTWTWSGPATSCGQDRGAQQGQGPNTRVYYHEGCSFEQEQQTSVTVTVSDGKGGTKSYTHGLRNEGVFDLSGR